MSLLSELANIRSGFHANAADYQIEGIKYFRPTDITDTGELLHREPIYLSRELVNDNHLLRKGDLLLTKVGSKIGDVAIFNENDTATASQNFLILTPNGITPEDLKKRILENKDKFKAAATGAAMPHISIQSILGIEI